VSQPLSRLLGSATVALGVSLVVTGVAATVLGVYEQRGPPGLGSAIGLVIATFGGVALGVGSVATALGLALRRSRAERTSTTRILVVASIAVLVLGVWMMPKVLLAIAVAGWVIAEVVQGRQS